MGTGLFWWSSLANHLVIGCTDREVHIPPRVLGVLSAFAGLGWLSFLSPTLGYRLFPCTAAFGLLGATALILWLLVFGVNEQRWKAQAAAAAAIST
jgi:hypothetical protein